MDGPVGIGPPSVGMWNALPWACWANESLWAWEGESVPANWAAARLDVTWRGAECGGSQKGKEGSQTVREEKSKRCTGMKEDGRGERNEQESGQKDGKEEGEWERKKMLTRKERPSKKQVPDCRCEQLLQPARCGL